MLAVLLPHLRGVRCGPAFIAAGRLPPGSPGTGVQQSAGQTRGARVPRSTQGLRTRPWPGGTRSSHTRLSPLRDSVGRHSLWWPPSCGWAGTQLVLAGRPAFPHFFLGSVNDFSATASLIMYLQMIMRVYKRALWLTHFALDPGDSQRCCSTLVLIS